MIWLSVYLEMIKYIYKQKTNWCKPDFENILRDRSCEWTVSARSLILAGQSFKKYVVLRCWSWSINSRIYWYQIRIFSSEKFHVNRRFKTSCLQMCQILRDIVSLLVLGSAFALWRCTAHAVPKDREERRNTGNDNDGNEQCYSSFESIKTSKLFKKNNTQRVYKHFEAMHFK